MVGTDRGHPLLDHQPRARAGGPFDAEAQMIVSAAFRGKRYAVFGLARSGLAAVRALVASGADVLAWDDNEAARQAAGGAEQVGRAHVWTPVHNEHLVCQLL